MVTQKQEEHAGSTHLNRGSGFKRWMILPVIVVVAIAGYAIVHFSEASSYTFLISPTQMTGGSLVTKQNGVSYRKDAVVGGAVGSQVTAAVDPTEITATQQVCAHGRFFDSGNVYITVDLPVDKSGTASTVGAQTASSTALTPTVGKLWSVKANTIDTVCTQQLIWGGQPAAHLSATVHVNSTTNFELDSIYGSPIVDGSPTEGFVGTLGNITDCGGTAESTPTCGYVLQTSTATYQIEGPATLQYETKTTSYVGKKFQVYGDLIAGGKNQFGFATPGTIDVTSMKPE